QSRLARAKEIEQSFNNAISEKKVGYVLYSAIAKDVSSERVIRLSSNKAKYTSCIYDALYTLDQLDLDQIIIETPPDDEEWDDVRDRLTKATFSR
ncbi:MAG: threonylcarbamoyl-AMP synthase, partial [Methylocystaceae bacterium]|nr:threonylcarbamoyl-AMP synthase [Methylocystaceae bacterium]